jgi:hypothetical protein
MVLNDRLSRHADEDSPDVGDTAPQQAPELAPEETVPMPPCQGFADASDAAAFASEVSAPSPAPAAAWMASLAEGLGEHIEDGRTAPGMPCEFELDVPGLGHLAGRVSFGKGQADLELRASRPAAAAALRARSTQLQRLVDRESGGDVNLFIL